MHGEWCRPVSLTLPQSPLPPPSPRKPTSKGSSSLVDTDSSTASMYHRYLRSVNSLLDNSNFDKKKCEDFDDIIPDNWVSDEEGGDSDDDDKNKDKDKEGGKTAEGVQKTNSFREMEVKWHQLMPPNTHMGSGSMGSGGRYVHSVYAQSDVKSPVIGYVTTARKVQAKLRKGTLLITHVIFIKCQS
jgi:hypothetical protein